MRSYLLLRDNTESGPYSFEELIAARIMSTDSVWIEGKSSAWQYPDEIEELLAFVHYASVININNRDVFNDTPGSQLRENSDNKPGPEGNESIPPYQFRDNEIQSIEKKNEENEHYEEEKPHAGNENQENKPDNSLLPKVINVIIADDHTLYREGVKMALSHKNDIKIVGEAENGMQLLHLLKHNLPDVILLDIQMPVMDGISALTSIRKIYGDLKVIMLSMYDDHSMVSTLMETGANAYLTKTADSESIYEAIKTCYTKSYYFNDLTNMSMLDKIRSAKKIPEKPLEQKIERPSQVFKMSPEMPTSRVSLSAADLQKKQDWPTSRKIRKQLLVTTCLILLITSGIMVGISILTHSAPIDPVLPQSHKQAEIKSVPVYLPSKAAPQSQPMDTARKMKVADNSFHEKTSLVLNDKKGLSGKNKEINNQTLKNTPDPPIIAKIDSNDNTDNVASAKKYLSEHDDKKAMVRKKLRNLVTAYTNNYNKDTTSGLSNIELTVYNQTFYKLDLVTVEVQYLLSDSSLYKTETMNFKSIEPLSSKEMEAPNSSMGVRIEYRVTTVKSKELNL